MQIQQEIMRLQNQIEEQVKKFNQIEKKAGQYKNARATLNEQESQNSLVLTQLQRLPQNAKIYKQVGGILIDQNLKQAKATLQQRIGFINQQIKSTQQLIRKNQEQQKKYVEKIQKAKEHYMRLMQHLQPK